jgi:hypothetical protein
MLKIPFGEKEEANAASYGYKMKNINLGG